MTFRRRSAALALSAFGALGLALLWREGTEPRTLPAAAGLQVFAAHRNVLTWSPVGDGSASYRIYRSASRGGHYGQIATTRIAAVTDDPPAAGIYWYRVAAVDAAGKLGPLSAPVSSDHVELSQTVGPAGGTLTPTTGTVRLEIPAGAVDRATTFTIEQIAPPAAGDADHALVTRAFDIGPSGTRFDPPATLTLRYELPAGMPAPVDLTPDGLGARYWDPSAKAWRALRGGRIDRSNSSVTAPIPHLSLWAAATITVPHGGYSSATDLCKTCHQNHQAVGDKLLASTVEREVCYSCHNGIGASDVQGEFGESLVVPTPTVSPSGSPSPTPAVTPPLSAHPVASPADGVQLTCSDCHTAHRSAADDARLLRVSSGGSYLYSPPGSPIGNSFCYACHSPASTLPTPFNRDYSGFETSAHNGDGMQGTPPGTGVKCLACHQAHASSNPLLQKDVEEQLCYRCHAPGDPNTSGGTNPYRDFNTATNDVTTSDGTPVQIFHHPIAASEQDGGARTVECISCHNPHLAGSTDVWPDSKLVDPADTNQKWPVSWGAGATMDNGNISQWCEVCHQNPAITQPIAAGPSVPFTVNMVDDGPGHDLFRAAEYDNHSLHGPSGGSLACTACHDPHGSSNAFMLRETIVDPSGTVTNTLRGFQDGYDLTQWDNFKWLCLTCHQDQASLDHANEMLAGGMVCKGCHFHGSDDF